MDNGTSLHGNEYNSVKYFKTLDTLKKVKTRALDF